MIRRDSENPDLNQDQGQPPQEPVQVAGGGPRLPDWMTGRLNQIFDENPASAPSESEVETLKAKTRNERKVQQELDKDANQQRADQAVDEVLMGPAPLGQANFDPARKEARNMSMLYFGDDVTIDQLNNMEWLTDKMQQYLRPRMGVQTWDKAREAASQLSETDNALFTALKWKDSQQPLNSEQFLIVKDGMTRLGGEITGFVKEHFKPNASGEYHPRAGLNADMKNALHVMINQYAMLDYAFRGTLKEAGRVLNISKMVKGASVDLESATDMFNRLGGDKMLSKIATQWIRQGDDLQGKIAYARALSKGRLSDALFELFTGQILFGIPTQARNLIGNAGHLGMLQVQEIGASYVHALAKAGKGLITGQGVAGAKDPIRARKAGALFSTVGDMWPQISQAARFGWVDDIDTQKLLEWKESGQVPRGLIRFGTKFDDFRFSADFRAESFGLDPNSAAGAALDAMGKHYVRLPYRAMQSMDSAFRVSRFEQNIRQQAMEDALKWGRQNGFAHNHPDVQARFNELVANPTENMRDIAHDVASDLTFQRRGERRSEGEFEIGFRSIGNIRGIPGARWIMPFVNTPANIMEKALQYSPGLNTLDVLKKMRSGDPHKKAEGLAQLGLSWSALSFAWLAMEEQEWDEDSKSYIAFPRITNGVPPSADAQRLKDMGWQPYSIRIGDQFVSYGSFEPAGMVLAMIATAHTNYKALTSSVNPEDHVEGVGIASAVMVGLAEYMGEKSMVKGLADIFTTYMYAKNREQHVGEALVSQVFSNLSGTLPIAGMQAYNQAKRSVRAMDTDAFENKMFDYYAGTPWETLLNKWFGAVRDIPTSYDRWGFKRDYNTAVRWSWINPTRVSDIEFHERDQWAEKLSINIGKPSRTQEFPGRLRNGQWVLDVNGVNSEGIRLDEIDPSGFLYSSLQREMGTGGREAIDQMLAGRGDDGRAFKTAIDDDEFLSEAAGKEIHIAATTATPLAQRKKTKKEVYLDVLGKGRDEGRDRWLRENKEVIQEYMNRYTGLVRRKTVYNTPNSELKFRGGR